MRALLRGVTRRQLQNEASEAEGRQEELQYLAIAALKNDADRENQEAGGCAWDMAIQYVNDSLWRNDYEETKAQLRLTKTKHWLTEEEIRVVNALETDEERDAQVQASAKATERANEAKTQNGSGGKGEAFKPRDFMEEARKATVP